MVNCCVFFVEPPSTCQFKSFKDAELGVKGGNASKLVRNGSDKAEATVTPPDDRGKKEKRGKDDDERRWWEE